MVNGEQLVGSLPTTYSPVNFNRDFFKVAINTTPVSTGGILKETDEISSIRVDLSDLESTQAFLQKAAVNAIISFGFDYNYYRGIVVAAGTNDDVNYIYNGSLDGNNIMYVQDITSQDWILPASGFCGRIVNTGTQESPTYTVQTWYPVLRLVAGWRAVEGGDYMRCIYCTYFNTSTGTVERTTLSTDNTVIDGVTEQNMYSYVGRDFRSEIPGIAIWNY